MQDCEVEKHTLCEGWYNELRGLGDTKVWCELESGDKDTGPAIWLQSESKLNLLHNKSVVYRAHDDFDHHALGKIRPVHFLNLN